MGWSMHRKPGLTFHNPAYSFKGYTIATPVGGDSVLLLDMAGRVVHQWRFADVRPEYAYLTERGTLLYRSLPPPPADFRFKPASEDDPPMPLEERARVLPSNYRYITEANWAGETLWRHEDPLLHHDFFATRDDTVLVTRFVQMDKALSDQVRGWNKARRSHHPMLTDEIQEVNRAGEVVWSVRLDEILDPKLDPLGPLRAADRMDAHQLDLPEPRRHGDHVLLEEHQPRRHHRQGEQDADLALRASHHVRPAPRALAAERQHPHVRQRHAARGPAVFARDRGRPQDQGGASGSTRPTRRSHSSAPTSRRPTGCRTATR